MDSCSAARVLWLVTRVIGFPFPLVGKPLLWVPDDAVVPSSDAAFQSPRLRGLYPPSYEITEPLTKPHTVSVLIVLVVLVGYAGISGVRLATQDGTSAETSNRATNIKTCVLGTVLLW